MNTLQRNEAIEYVDFKLQQSGGSAKKVFARRALAELVDHSQGIPRQLNLLCNNALIRAYGAGLPWVTLRVAQAAVKEYENLAGMHEKFHEPLGRRALHSMTERPAALLTGFGFVVLAGLYCLGMRVPAIRLTFGSEDRWQAQIRHNIKESLPTTLIALLQLGIKIPASQRVALQGVEPPAPLHRRKPILEWRTARSTILLQRRDQ